MYSKKDTKILKIIILKIIKSALNVLLNSTGY